MDVYKTAENDLLVYVTDPNLLGLKLCHSCVVVISSILDES